MGYSMPTPGDSDQCHGNETMLQTCRVIKFNYSGKFLSLAQFSMWPHSWHSCGAECCAEMGPVIGALMGLLLRRKEIGTVLNYMIIEK